jgi:hypothetical protein
VVQSPGCVWLEPLRDDLAFVVLAKDLRGDD